MTKNMLSENRFLSSLLTREITFVLIIKAVVIFTSKHFYFSNFTPFYAGLLFGIVQSDILATDYIENH